MPEEFPSPLPRPQSRGEEIANSLSHGLGFIVAAFMTPLLLISALQRGSTAFFVGTVIFSVTILALYFLSALYHAWPSPGGKEVLQLADHCGIFLLIAGTYTPFTLGPLRGKVGTTVLMIVWAIALFGIVLKTTRAAFRNSKLSLLLYLAMGWLILLFIRPVLANVPPAALFWLFGGGGVYTCGVLFFVCDGRRYHHFVWHLFVLAGSGCHFLAILSCIN